MEILKAIHLKKYYGNGENTVKAVNDISFSIEKRQFLLLWWEHPEAEKPLY